MKDTASPPPTARAIAEQMLVALVQAEAGGFSLSSGGAVWVEPRNDLSADDFSAVLRFCGKAQVARQL